MIRARVPLLALAALALSFASAPGAPAGSKPAAAKPATSRSTHRAAPTDSDAVLVRVGDEAITRHTIAERLEEIPEQYRANYESPEGRQQLLQRIVEEHAWLQDAHKIGIENRPDVKRQLASQRRDLLIRTRINELLAGNPAPSDSEAKIYYDAHGADFKTPATAALRHIQLKTEADGRKVLALAKAKDADWAKLVNAWSTDSTTKSAAGNLGTVTKEGGFAGLGSQPALAESAFAVGEGHVGGPFKTDKGWHVIKVDSVHPESTRPFDQVKSFITRQLSQQRQQTYYQEQLSKVKERVGVTPDSSVIKGWLATKKTARELFQDAQQAGGPDQRIAAYKKVVDAFPDADVAPQAQFMVGFIYSEELKNYDDAEKVFRALLAKYPRSELKASAQWMVDHMRTEEAPDFLHTKADSTATGPTAGKSPKK